MKKLIVSIFLLACISLKGQEKKDPLISFVEYIKSTSCLQITKDTKFLAPEIAMAAFVTYKRAGPFATAVSVCGIGLGHFLVCNIYNDIDEKDYSTEDLRNTLIITAGSLAATNKYGWKAGALLASSVLLRDIANTALDMWVNYQKNKMKNDLTTKRHYYILDSNQARIKRATEEYEKNKTTIENFQKSFPDYSTKFNTALASLICFTAAAHCGMYAHQFVKTNGLPKISLKDLSLIKNFTLNFFNPVKES